MYVVFMEVGGGVPAGKDEGQRTSEEDPCHIVVFRLSLLLQYMKGWLSIPVF